MKKGSFPFYYSQIKLQLSNPNKSISDNAGEIIRVLDRRVKEKTGRTPSQLNAQEMRAIPFDINQKDIQHKKFWGSAGMLSYEESSHFLGFFGKKNRAKRKKLLGGLTKGIGNAIKGIAKIVTSPALLALLPFKGAMKKQIIKKGGTPKKKLRALAEQFYKSVIKSYDYSGGYENYYTDLQVGNLEEGENSEKKGGGFAFAMIIPAIIDFFKMLGKKKDDGTASAEDKELLAEVAREQEKLDKDPEYKAKVVAENNVANNSGSAMSPMMMIILAVLAIIIIKK